MAGTKFFNRINTIVRRCLRELWMETDLSDEAWSSIKEGFSNKRAYCDRACTGNPRTGLTPDHIEPHRDGGELVPENIIPACQDCNDLRGAMNWRDFLQKHFATTAEPRTAKIESYCASNPYRPTSPEVSLPPDLLKKFREIEEEWSILLGKMRVLRDEIKLYKESSRKG